MRSDLSALSRALKRRFPSLYAATSLIGSAVITSGSVVNITDLAVADGGTGASTASGARTNLGLGTLAVVASPCPVANGGTGAATLAGAGIVAKVGTSYNGTALSDSVSVTALLATGHAAGFYRVSCYLNTTTAGDGTVTPLVNYSDGIARTSRLIPTLDVLGVVAPLDLSVSTDLVQGQFLLYSAGDAAITFSLTVDGKTGSPEFTARLRLEYLGA